MILERSILGKSAKSVFYEDVNDIDIYIEDTALGYQKLYERIFSRVFNGYYNLYRVFPLGNRDAVISEYESKIDNISRPTLYVVDGDLDLIGSADDVCRNGLFSLPIYCIENIFADEQAWLVVLDEEENVKSFPDVAALFNFSDWAEKNRDLLYQLFLAYSICKKVCPEFPTVSFPVNRLVSSDDGVLDRKKVFDRVCEIKNHVIRSVGEREFDRLKEEVVDNIRKKDLSAFDVASGKDYLFPLLKTRFRSTVKTKIPDINLKQRLAKQCSVEKLKCCLNYVAVNDSVKE